jgi:hypothetical protein
MTVIGFGNVESALMQEKGFSLNAFPETLMNTNFWVMSQDMPDEKQARFCSIYSLNVAPLQHRPIF